MSFTNINTVYVVFGASGSGKDTVADYLYNTAVALPVKFAAPVKRFIEKTYGLDVGVLDKPEGKSMTLPDSSGKTFLDLLIGLYHFTTIYDDAMFARGVVKEIERLLKTSTWDVVISDMRKLVEAELLLDALIRTGAELVVVQMEGRGSTLSSDLAQKVCLDYLCYSYGIEPVVIDNSGSKADLYISIEDKVLPA
jgi:hypothetical protein